MFLNTEDCGGMSAALLSEKKGMVALPLYSEGFRPVCSFIYSHFPAYFAEALCQVLEMHL